MILHPDTCPRDGNKTKYHNRGAANHGCRDGVDQCAEFWGKAEQHRHHRRRHEDQRRVDFGHCHHADVFRVGRHAAAADRAGEHGRQTVSHKRPSHIRVHIAAGHSRYGFQMAQVFSHQNHRDRRDEHHRLSVKGGRGYVRHAEPGGLMNQCEINRFAEAEHVRQQRVDQTGRNQPDQDQQPLDHAARKDRHHADAQHRNHRHPAFKR